MKKLLIAFLVLFALTGCETGIEPLDTHDKIAEEYDGLESGHLLVEYSGTNFELIIDSEEKQVVYIGRPTWPYCQWLVGPLNEVAKKKNVNIPYLNSSSAVNTADKLMEKFGIQGVPAIIVVQNGEVVEYLYDEKWFEMGLADENSQINLEVLELFFDQVNE